MNQELAPFLRQFATMAEEMRDAAIDVARILEEKV